MECHCHSFHIFERQSNCRHQHQQRASHQELRAQSNERNPIQSLEHRTNSPIELRTNCGAHATNAGIHESTRFVCIDLKPSARHQENANHLHEPDPALTFEVSRLEWRLITSRLCPRKNPYVHPACLPSMPIHAHLRRWQLADLPRMRA